MCALRPDAGVEPGVLLVASPMLGDPNFRRTVVYVLDHRPDGSVGVVLNRPSDVTLLDVLPQWFDLASAPRTLFVGGPVETNAALCLAEARAGSSPSGWTEVSGPVGLTDLDTDPGVGRAGPAPGPGLRRVRRLGRRAAGRRDRRGGLDGGRRARRRRRSPTRAAISGGTCCAGRAGRSRCWPPIRTTPG